MQNTDCCPSCDKTKRFETVRVLGKDVRVKNYICSPDGVTYQKKTGGLRLQMSVCPTAYCPAGCPFCIAKNTKSPQRIDLKKFERTMRLLKEQDLVRAMKITGGEPFYDVGLLNEVISVLYDVFGLEFEISISTNGIHLGELHWIRNLERVEAIHISRHHYDDAVNKMLFGGADVPSGDELREIIGTISYKDIFVLNCTLLRDYIHSPEEAHKFLDFAVCIGAAKVGFVTCSPINDYAREQTIPYADVLRDDDPSLLFTRQFCDHEICRCRDGVYVSPDGSIIEFYGRSTKTGDCGYSRGLVYDADDHLRDGFGGEIIL